MTRRVENVTQRRNANLDPLLHSESGVWNITASRYSARLPIRLCGILTPC